MFDDYRLLSLMNTRSQKETGREKLEALFGPHWGQRYQGEMKSDHGERTNRKLNDQPFYHRGAKGKMSKW